MNTRTATRLAWGLFAVACLVFAGAAWLSIAAHDASGVLPFLPALLTFSAVGALVASRRPSNPLGWLMLGMGAMSLGLLADGFARYGLSRAPHTVGTAWAAWVFVISIEVSTAPLAFILLLFPHGRLLSPRWRIVGWAAAVLPVVGALCTGISDVNFSARTNFPTLHDPVQLVSSSTMSPIYGAAQVANLIALLVAAASLLLRYRRAGGEERQQLKWIAFAGALATVGFIALATIPNAPEPVLVFIVVVPLIAIAAGVAILKYRLYDIDVVINKTLVYGSLAAFITAVYVAIVVGIGAAIGQGSKPNLGLSILATAVVAVAFQPVRERVQRLANRLVYGKRATPYEVLSEFSSRMAGAYAMEDLLPRMARILAEGTGAKEATVWLHVGSDLRPEASWPNGADGPPAVALTGDEMPSIEGTTLSLPVHHGDELLGALTLTKSSGERLAPAEEKLAGDLASQAGLVLRNVRLTEELLARVEELRVSRKRIVAAQDVERRKLERNIHDGAQQQLVALAVRLRLARQLAGRDPAAADAAITQIEREAAEALEDLRDLARGIYPPLLADKGLVAALEAQSRKAPIAVTVEAGVVGRFPQEQEAAVYFCALEALQNVAKYSGSAEAIVRLAEHDGNLVFDVIDHGRGFDPSTRSYGTGLQGMADRLSALGGSLEVRTSPGAGTTVTGRVPAGRVRSKEMAVVG
jgi:signal transduction histidine kinase